MPEGSNQIYKSSKNFKSQWSVVGEDISFSPWTTDYGQLTARHRVQNRISGLFL